jgi:chaperonin cofactor prefoldin
MKITGQSLYQLLMQRKTVVTKVSAEEIQNVKNPKARAVLREIAQIDKNPKSATPREFALAAERMQRKLLDVKAKQWVGVVDGLTKSKRVKAEIEANEDFQVITAAEWVEIFEKNGLTNKTSGSQEGDDGDLFCAMTDKDLQRLLDAQKRKNEVVAELGAVVKELNTIRDYMNQLDQTIDNEDIHLTKAQGDLKIAEVENKEVRAIELEEQKELLEKELKSLQREIDLIEQEQVNLKKVGVEIDNLLQKYGPVNDHEVPPELPVVTRVIKLPKGPVVGR